MEMKMFKFEEKDNDDLIDSRLDEEFEKYKDSQSHCDNSTDIPLLLDEIHNEYGDLLKESSTDQSCFNLSKEETEKKFEDSVGKLKPETDVNTNCATCSKQVRLQNATVVKRGDHLSFPGCIGKRYVKHKRVQSHFYKHHAIVKEVLSQSDTNLEAVMIHFTRESNAIIKICETHETYDLKHNDINVVEYSHPKYLPDEVVKRAESMLSQNATEQCLFLKYNPLTCNCEHFATWCVVGEKQSLQVSGLREKTSECIAKLLGIGSIITKALLQLLFVSSDEIASNLTNTIGIPEIVVSGSAALYLLYCILMTILHIRKNRKHKMCWPCLKGKLIDLWAAFGVFGVTSTISFLVINFALPLMAPGIGIPLEIMLILVSCAIQKSVPYIRQALQSPMRYQKTQIGSLYSLNVGDIISLRYYKIPHDLIVTEVHATNKWLGRIRCIHYGLPNLFGPREIIEEYLDINLNKNNIYLYVLSHIQRFSGEEVVSRARKRVGEIKWNITSNTSSNLCQWAISTYSTARSCCPNKALKANPSSTLLVEEKEVHLLKDLQKGDVVNYRGLGMVLDLRSKDGGNDREFELDLIIYDVQWLDYVVNKRTFHINLHKERLYVKHFHPSLCQSMETRMQRAEKLVGTKGKRWKIVESLENCIVRDEPMGRCRLV